jgi:hypothetical protein
MADYVAASTGRQYGEIEYGGLPVKYANFTNGGLRLLLNPDIHGLRRLG